MLKILLFFYPDFFRDYFSISYYFGKQSVLNIICCFYDFNLENIKQPTVYQHQVFYCDNYMPSTFKQAIFFIYIRECIFYCYISLFVKKFKFSQYKFSIFIYP